MEIKVKIPDNLNIAELLQAANIEPKSNLVDKIAFICYQIHLAAVYHRDYLADTDRPYFPLYSKILQKFIRDYAEIEDILIDKLKVIECNDIYSRRHHKSFGFRFADKYYGQKHKEHEIVTIGLHNKMQAYFNSDFLPSKDTKQYLFLKKFWTDGKLKMDIEGAMKWINVTYQNELNYINYHFAKLVEAKKLTAKKAEQQKETAIKKITEKTENWKTSVQNFNAGRTVFHADNFSKRLHTKLTNLKKELRGFITYDGKQLVSLDIKNSQPYLALVILNEDFWRERAKKGQKLLLYRKIGIERIKEEERKRIIDSIMLSKTSESYAGKGFEFYHFLGLVTSGQLYEFFMDEFEENEINPHSREAVKKKFLKYLYHNPSMYEEYVGEENYKGVFLIKDIFPNISDLFGQLKEGCFSFHGLNAEDSYKFPPQLLQRTESHLVIEVVCKGLKRGNKLMPLFTIHDSIVTTKEYEQIVHDKMKLELTKAIGYEPKIQPEYFTPSPDFIDINYVTVKDGAAFSDELLDRLSEW